MIENQEIQALIREAIADAENHPTQADNSLPSQLSARGFLLSHPSDTGDDVQNREDIPL